jgi:very-short-patch-repair endonuclease
MPYDRHDPSLHRARRLRKDSTTPERLLWGQLRNRRLAGLKFRRQQPLGHYVLDFYCEEHCLAIELDGDSHIGQAAKDFERQRWIQSQGVRVLRFGNDEIIREMDSVLAGILIACGIKR